jgi:serine/threonine protein kinase
MKDIDLFHSLFNTTNIRISRLKEIEKTINSLNAKQTKGLDTQILFIKKNVKNLTYFDDVEKQFVRLMARLPKDETTIKDSPKSNEQTLVDVSKLPPSASKIIKEDLETIYEIQEVIGGGGFADVYKAKSKVDGKIIAVKMPHIPKFNTIEPSMFIREAELWSCLNHHNIVEIIGFGTKPYPWLAMEYCINGSLRQRINKISLAEALTIAIYICEALYYTHHRGVVHRDIKPENILFNSSNIPKLTDWGLGKMMLDISLQSGYSGTPAYSSPEQIKSDDFGEIDTRTDIYQLGVILYEMVTKRRPFDGKSSFETATNIVKGDYIKASKINTLIPRNIDIDSVIDKCLAKEKKNRYQDVSILKSVLEEILIKVQATH